jgi:hypothetical protein
MIIMIIIFNSCLNQQHFLGLGFFKITWGQHKYFDKYYKKDLEQMKNKDK